MVSGQDPDSISGQTIIWEFGNLSIGESREVVFNVATIGLLGYQGLIDVYPDTRVEYNDYLDELQLEPFPETSIDIASCVVPETGSITIIKDSQPDDYQEFVFSGDLWVDFILVDDGVNPTDSRSFDDILTGSYIVTEEAVSGWTLDSISCTGGDYQTELASGTVTIDLNSGEDIVCTFVNSKDVNPDDVVINEIMQNPDVVSDDNGEWFELYNTTANPVHLDGCIVRDDGANAFTITSLSVPIGGYAVLSNNDDFASNGGVSVNYKYPGNFILGNDADEIIIECGGIIIDEVWYDGGPNFPNPTGASMILNNPANDNNNGDNWCESTSVYGSGDLGTPGALNDPCGLCSDVDDDGVCDYEDNCV
ncbi:MAG: lamin tail domain-containing protein, partial [Candidatus Pacebacteria bacterium]|nr:lamin tail domain-containing protein [Candidatus Paceibacterota bacterium]